MPTPYYPFGYGLTYTSFDYSGVECKTGKISLSDIKEGKKLCVSVNVTNTGKTDGKETVQLYIRDVCASLMRPIRELKGFKKTEIKAGETKKVSFELGFDNLGYYDGTGNYVVEKGTIEIYIGKNCLTDNGTKIEII